jgi:D-glycero-alpha-D-manno-heptose-7-phosphate kinase
MDWDEFSMLISSRTPLRVSFFGGGTDYPEYFERDRGAVVGMAIDKYVYISALRLIDFIEYKYRVSYSRLEMVHDIADIEHPVVRNVLRHYGVEQALDLSIAADLPARSGLGSSSSFTVGMINLMNALRGLSVTKLDLGREAVFVERELLRERVGVQDQLHAAFGGINRFDFTQGRIRISPLQLTAASQRMLTESLLLLHTGVSRFASETLDEQITRTVDRGNDQALSHLLSLCDQVVDVLEGADPDIMIREFGAMMHDGWMTKRRLSDKVSSPQIDQLYEHARAQGALGGKLCGAGSGGFLLMVVPPAVQPKFLEQLGDVRVIRIGLDTQGSTILRN